jgi:magnesium-transporting ATPase (P-type)
MSRTATQHTSRAEPCVGSGRQSTVAALPIPDVYQVLEARPGGLTQAEAAARLQHYGPNAIREVKGTSLVLKFLANFTHLMALLLWIGGAEAFIAQLPQLGIAIWMVNLINGALRVRCAAHDRPREQPAQRLDVHARDGCGCRLEPVD